MDWILAIEKEIVYREDICRYIVKRNYCLYYVMIFLCKIGNH